MLPVMLMCGQRWGLHMTATTAIWKVKKNRFNRCQHFSLAKSEILLSNFCSSFSKSTLSDFFVNYLLKLTLKKSSHAKKRKYYTSYLMDFLFLGLSISFGSLILNQFCRIAQIIWKLGLFFHLPSYPTCSSYWLGLQLGKEDLFVVGGNCRDNIHQSEK